MSAPEPGIMSGAQPASNSQPMIHPVQLSYSADGTAAYKPVFGNSLPFHNAKPAGNGNGAASVGGGEGINVNIPIGGSGGSEQTKKKRGRPRKYDGGALPVPFASVPSPAPVSMIPPPPQHHHQQQPPQQQQWPPQQQYHPQQAPPQQPSQQQQEMLQHHQKPEHQQQQPSQQQQKQEPQSQAEGGTGGTESLVKKARGRPPGSINKKKREQQQQQQQQEQQLDAMGSPRIGFTPHVITVNTGEDISSKIMSVSQNGPRAICILSAIGTISSVTLRQAVTSSSSVTYEGYFEILSLSGSFMLSENGGGRSRSGSLSVSLAGPDGRVFGGGVAGLLTAASPVQVVVGSFIADGRRELNVPNQTEPLFTSSRLHAATGQPAANSPPSRGTLSESSGGPGSPLNQSAAAVNSTPLGMSNLPWK